MSYVKDKDAHTRGVGAIAAADARDPRATRHRRMARALNTERRDQRMANLKGALGAINLGGGRRWIAAHVFGTAGNLQGGSGIEGAPQGLPPNSWGGWTGPRGGAPGQTPPTLIQKLLGTTGAFKQMAAKPLIPGQVGGGPWFPPPPQTSGGIPVPTGSGSTIPTDGSSSAGASSGGGGWSGGGGGGGGGGDGTTDGSTDPGTATSSPIDSVVSQIPGGMTTVLVGGAALLYLIFRKKGG